MVETDAGQQGWVFLSFLKVQGDVTAAPIISPDQKAAATTTQAGYIPSAPQAEPAAFTEPAAASTTAGLNVVSIAHIAQNEVYVRSGPSTDYTGIDKLTNPQEQLNVLALDQSGKWALIQSASAKIGWAAVTELSATSPLSDAPKIYTAWVVSNAIEARSGPGIYHEQTGQLAINSLVRVLGRDDSGSWALIQPIPGGSLGWSPIQFLKNVGQP